MSVHPRLFFGLWLCVSALSTRVVHAQDWPPPRPRYEEPPRPRNEEPSRPRYDDDAPRQRYDEEPHRQRYDEPNRPRYDEPNRPRYDEAPRQRYDEPNRPRYDESRYDRRDDSRRYADSDSDSNRGDIGLAPTTSTTLSRDRSPSSDKLFSGGEVAILGAIDSSPMISLGINAGDLMFSLGVAIGYNVLGTTSAATESSVAPSKVSFSFATSIAYMAYDAQPLAFGPEIDLFTRLAPSPAITGYTLLRPGFALWYAPFRAPIYFGTMIGLSFTFMKGLDPSISTDYPGLRLRWGF